jgi:transcriptional regulator with XRE-family HTH domain
MAIDINKHFSNEVKKQRDKQKLSQLDLAELAKVNLSTINRLERGLENITLRNAFKITKALHIPIYKFFLVDKPSRKIERKNEIEGRPIEEVLKN